MIMDDTREHEREKRKKRKERKKALSQIGK